MPYISAKLPKNSFHLGSFSKTLVPSYRIGWIRADESLIQSIIIIKESMDLHSSGFVQFVLADYLKDDEKYERHLQEIRDDYGQKAKYFSEQLNIILPEFKHQTPKGGMFLYGSLGDEIDTFKLVYECLKKKVVYVPGNQFYIDKVPNGEIRFNYTHATTEQIQKGIKLIREVYEANRL
jgi:2-aminoadipate transaminase